MNTWLSLIAFVLFFSGLRVHLGAQRASRLQITRAQGVAFAVLVILAVGAARALEALEVSTPTFWIAAGGVITVASFVGFARLLGSAWPVAPEASVAAMPLVWPLLLSPELVMHSLSVGANDFGVAVLGLGLGALVGVYVATREISTQLAAALYRAQSVAGLMIGIAWLVEGSRSVLL